MEITLVAILNMLYISVFLLRKYFSVHTNSSLSPNLGHRKAFSGEGSY